MKRRMPLTIIITHDPLLTGEVQDDEPNDSNAVTNYLWNEYLNERTHNFRCESWRSGGPARQGGREPSDEPHSQIAVHIPGAIPFDVKITDVAVFLEEPEQRVYTIVNLNTDRLEYAALLNMEEFGHRAGRGAI